MKSHQSNPARAIAASALFLLLAACAPSHDWRDVRGTTAPFKVLLPAKPTVLSRSITLVGVPVTMTMTAAEIDGVTYAVGNAMLPDGDLATRAATAMKLALVANMQGVVRREKSVDDANGRHIELDALGKLQGATQRLLIARFYTYKQNAYQVIVSGPEKKVSADQVEVFMTSFKPEG